MIGAGNGREARPICNDGHRIVCTDISWMYLESGRRLFEAEAINCIKFVQADVYEGFPFDDDSFDFVFYSLHSSMGTSRFEVLRRIQTIIRENGLLLHTCATPLYPSLYPDSNFDNWFFFDCAEQLEQEVKVCGFTLLESLVDPERQEYRCSLLQKQS